MAARFISSVANAVTGLRYFSDSKDGTYISVDGYAGYNKLKNFRRCCCYAHIRRYSMEAIPKGRETVDGCDRILNMTEKSPTPATHWCCPPFYYIKKCKCTKNSNDY